MQKTVLGLFVLALIASPTTANASVKTNVSVTTNTGNSNSYTHSQGSNETHIIMETNGERQEYHGSDPSVNMESKDGHNKVTINGNKPSSTTSPTSKPTGAPTSSPTSTPSASPTPTATQTPDVSITLNGEVLGESTTPKQKDTLFEYLTRVISSIFDKLF